MLNLLRNTVSNFRVSQATEDANNFLAATGITGQVQSQAIYNLVNDLQASGLWSKMKAVYPMVTDNYNLLSYTEDFSNAVWTKSGATVTNNDIIAPNGTLTADKVIFGAANNYIYQSASSAINTCTQSVYIKGTAGETISFDDLFTYIPLVTLTGDWQRVSWTSTNGSPHGLVISSAQGATARTVWVWGGQIELGSTLKTYQPILTTPAAFMASQMKYNLKDARDLDAAFRLTWSGGWTYSATGATPNGTNAFANTNFSPSANLTINSSHLSIYSRTAIGNLPQSDMGSYSTSTTDAFTIAIAYNNTCYMGSYAFSGTNFYVDFTNTDSRGLYINSRTSATLLKGYKNNTIGDTSTNSVAGVLPTLNTIIGAENFNGVPTSYSTKQYAFATMGNGLSDQDAQLLNQIVEKYQVALSRGVQAAQSFYYNSAYSNEANTYLYSTQITGTTQVSAINTLINGLKANNLWTKMKAVYPFVTDKTLQADMAAQMKFNLVNPQDTDAAFRLAFSGGWTYSTNGALPNGTNGYADTYLIPNTNLALNSASFSVYSRNDFTPLANQSFGVTSNAIFRPIIGVTIDVNKAVKGFAYNYGSPDELTSSNGINLSAMFITTRTAVTSAKLFRNITQLASVTTQGQTSQPTTSFTFGAFKNSTTFQDYNSFQYAFAHIGDGLTDAEAAQFYQLVQEFQTSLSRNV